MRNSFAALIISLALTAPALAAMEGPMADQTEGVRHTMSFSSGAAENTVILIWPEARKTADGFHAGLSVGATPWSSARTYPFSPRVGFAPLSGQPEDIAWPPAAAEAWRLDDGDDADSARAPLVEGGDGIALMAGTGFGLSDEASGSLFAGYRQRARPGAPGRHTDDIAFGGRLGWSFTPRTRVSAGIMRWIEGPRGALAERAIATRFDATVAHAVDNDLTLSAYAGFLSEVRDGAERADEIRGFTIGGGVLLNAYLQFSLEYDYKERTQGLDETPINESIFLMRLTGRW